LAGKIGRMTPAGSLTEFSLPLSTSGPSGITPGPDGNIWFTERQSIGRITTTGIVTEFTIPTMSSGPMGITIGPDNNLWFAEAAGKIASIVP
jgi:virginiamycin B lyase